MASITLTVNTKADTSKFALAGQERNSIKKLMNVMHGLLSGALIGKIVATPSTTDAVAATGTITLASVLAADTVTIGKTTLTASATPSGENQFSQAGSDTADAASLVTIINAHSTLGNIVKATSSGAVVTITSIVPGVIGNQIVLSSSNGTRLAVSGSGYLASGAGGQSNTYITLGRS